MAADNLAKQARGNWFGPYAPPPTVPFPQVANITAIELLTFLPNSLKSQDVVYRLASNGFTRSAIHATVNNNRNIHKEWPANTCGLTLYQTMRNAGLEDWSFKVHDRWHKDEVKEKWDSKNISVAGFEVPFGPDIEKTITSTHAVPFENLGKGIRIWPTHYDALDLTRMVRYAMQHSKDKWMYPTDYRRLLDLLGGPMRVEFHHTDGQCFERCPKVILEPERFSKRAISGTTPEATYKRSVSEFNDSTPWPKQKRGRPRQERLVEAVDKIGAVDNIKSEGLYDEQIKQWNAYEKFEFYVRGARPSKAYPVPKVTTAFSDRELELAFKARGEGTAPDRYSACAFVGPRICKPYRPLHLIDYPDSNDMSAWAENLRWAAEQHSAFKWDAIGWNESPEHMRLIDQYRKDDVWVSKEWLQDYEEQYADSEKYRPRRRPEKAVYPSPIEGDYEAGAVYWIHYGLGANMTLPEPDEQFFETPSA